MKKLMLLMIGLALIITSLIIEAKIPEIQPIDNLCLVRPANHLILMLLGFNLIILSALCSNKRNNKLIKEK